MKYLFSVAFSHVCRLAGDQRARRDSRHDSDAEDDDDVKKVNPQEPQVHSFTWWHTYNLILDIIGHTDLNSG